MFTESEKLIFSYPNPFSDETPMHEDPLKLRRRLLIHSEGCFEEWVSQLAASPPAEPQDAAAKREWLLRQATLEDQVVAAARKALDGVPEVDPDSGAGVPDAWVLGVVRLFLKFLHEKKARRE